MPNSQNYLTGLNVTISPADINCYRKVKLTDGLIQAKTADNLHKLCDNYKNIFSKHSTNSRKQS